jgi:hypothetical protein
MKGPTVVGIASMHKALSIVGTAIAALLLLVFGLDLAFGFPFEGAQPTMDIAFIVCSLILGYLCWDTLRELK